MNILFVSQDNTIYGGDFLSMVKLADILQREYHHQVLVLLPKRGNGKRLLDENNIESIVLRYSSWVVKISEKDKLRTRVKHRVKRLLNFFAEIVAEIIIKKRRIDIVHINSSYTQIGARAAKKNGIPYVWHIREFMEEDHGLQLWDKANGYKLMKLASRCVAISQSVYDKYVQILGKDKLTVIMNGIDPKDYYIHGRRIFQREKVNLLIIGHICEKKGQIDAINACILLYKLGYTNFCLSIVGAEDDIYVQHLKELAADLTKNEHILFCGPTKNPSEYYSKADVVLMCSVSEAYGRVTVEGMMSGALVIGAESAATAEIIQDGHTGLLYEKRNEKHLATQIAYAMDNREHVRMIAQNGQQYALKNFTAKANAARVNKMYDDLMMREDTSGGGYYEYLVVYYICLYSYSSPVDFYVSQV